MSFLVRKISRAKWPDFTTHITNLSADSITTDLKTVNNKLSLWHITNYQQIDEAALAVLTNLDSITRIDFAILDITELQDMGFQIKNRPGNTAYKYYVNKHYDLVDIQFKSLVKIAKHVHHKLIAAFFVRKTESQMKRILEDAIHNDYVDVNDLKPSMQQSVKKHLSI